MTTPDPIRAALERLINAVLDGLAHDDHPMGSARVDDAIAAARAALAAARAVPNGYIDPEHQGEDRAMLDVFYAACLAEGGTADEITLRGLHAVLARWGRPAPAATEGEAMEQPEASEGEARALARAIDEVAKGWHPQACLLGNVTAKQFRRAAALLRQYWLWLGRQQRLQQENHRFREPERTILCDILANGTLLPDPDGTRYWDPSNAPAVVPVAVDDWRPIETAPTNGACSTANRSTPSSAPWSRSPMPEPMFLHLARCATDRAHLAAHEGDRARYWRELAAADRLAGFADPSVLAQFDALGGDA